MGSPLIQTRKLRGLEILVSLNLIKDFGFNLVLKCIVDTQFKPISNTNGITNIDITPLYNKLSYYILTT